MLLLAADLASSDEHGRLVVLGPVISPQTVQQEWDRMLAAIDGEVRNRLSLTIQPDMDSRSSLHRDTRRPVRLSPPNYRYEILRILLEADLSGEQPPTISQLNELIGASQTPIRAALDELKASGLVRYTAGSLQARAEEISLDALARTRAMPLTMRFRFELGAIIKSPAQLLERARSLLQARVGEPWSVMALSGVSAAQIDVPAIDIAGVPRIDLIAVIDRKQKTFDTTALRRLDDGLELQQNVLEPAPVVVTLVRSRITRIRQDVSAGLRYASKSDVLMSLLDLGLREQARQYLRVLRS